MKPFRFFIHTRPLPFFHSTLLTQVVKLSSASLTNSGLKLSKNPPGFGRKVAYMQALWTQAELALARDVGMILDPDTKQLPDRLFKDPSYADDFEYEDLDPDLDLGSNTGTIVRAPFIRGVTLDYSEGIGRQFPTFLRRIGKIKATMIRPLELHFSHALNASRYFPTFCGDIAAAYTRTASTTDR